MGLKSDKWIKEQAEQWGMIEPFVDHQVREGNISYGLSSYGYDMRVADEFKIMYPPTPGTKDIIDPKDFDSRLFVDVQTTICYIPANSYVLARSVEMFRIPENVTGICVGKSTYVRSGIHILMSPAEAGWFGHLTLEIANLSPYPAKIYANEGIAQMLFFEGDEECLVTYDERKGKYQNQEGIVLSRI